jgi:hypothetical protein
MADIRITPASSIMAFTSSLAFKETLTQDASGSIVLAGSGSTGRTNLFAVDGNNGRLFSIDDDLSNSLFSVNTIAGLPVIEAFADNTVNIGKYGAYSFVATGSGDARIGSGSVMFVSASGNVGIGSLVPAGKLSVDGGDIRFNSGNAAANYYVSLNHNSSNDGGIIWARNNTPDWQMVNATSGDFWMYSYGTSTVAFTLQKSSGNVGIGTTSPNKLLELVSTGEQLRLSYNTSVYTDFRTDSAGGLLINANNNYIINYIGGSEKMRITSAGNVGIGTTSPNAPLDVTSATSSTSGLQQWSYNSAPASYRLQLNTDVSSGLVKYSFDLLNAGTAYNNNLVLDRGSVGIGTISPSSKLHLAGQAELLRLTHDNAYISFYNTANTTRTGYIQYNTGADVAIMGETATALSLGTGGTVRLYINSSGNVGIGITTPQAPLSFANAVGNKIDFYHSTVSTGDRYGIQVQSDQLIIHSGAGGLSTGGILLGKSTTSTFTEAMRITNGGDVGIGTTSPAQKLHVQGSNLMVTFQNSSTGVDQYTQLEFKAGSRDAYIWLGNQNTTSWAGDGGLNIYTGTGHMDFWTAITQRMRITSAGNVGIGTPSPNGKLQVNNGTDLNVAINTVANDATTVSRISSLNDAATLSMPLVINGNRLVFTTDATERMRITSAGLVGIGTTNPTYKLEVHNNAAALAARLYSSTTSTQVNIGSTDNSSLSNIVWNNDSGNAQIFRGGSTFASWAGALSLNIYNSNGVIAFHPGATANVLYLNTSGLVGIGTSSPIATLTVRTAANSVVGISDNTGIPKIGGYLDNGTLDDLQIDSTILYVSNNNSTTMAVSGSKVLIGLTSTVLSNKLVVQGDIWCTGITGSIITPGLNTQVLYNNAGTWDGASGLVYSSGNVGIGTTSPLNLLHVSQASANTIFRLGNNASYDQFIYFNGNNDWSLGMDYSNSNAFVLSNASSIGTNDRLVVTTGGNVGIGVTNPSGKLHIYGADTIVTLTNTNASGYGEFTFYEGSTLKAEMFAVGSSLSTYAGANSFIIYQNSNDPIAFYTNGTNERMRITGAGNVGIGTTNPSTKLDVVGTNIRTDKAFMSQGSNATWSGAACFMDYISASSYGRIGVYDYGEPNWQNLYVGGGGKVGIGTTTFTYKLNLLGDLYITGGSIGVGVAPNSTDGRIDASNDIVAYSTSDIRFKENIQRIPNALEKVNTLSGNTFTWKPDPELTKLHGFEGNDVGIIAQEIEAILPDIVTTRDSGYKAVKYEKLVPLLIEAIKELTDKVNKLENR